MSRSIRSIFFLFVIVFSFHLESKGQIIETNDISHVLSYVEKGTLFVFDIDNTLIEPTQYLGSDQWFFHEVQALVKKGHSNREAIQKMVPTWLKIQSITPVQPVDPNTPNLLRQLKQLDVLMIALTKRPPQLADRTLDQLRPHEIDFSESAAIKGDLLFSDLSSTLYKNGIVFIAQEEPAKGPILAAFLKKMKEMPKRLVVIDDKRSHLESLSDAADALQIPFIGIRYGKADKRFDNFDHRIAEVQWDTMGKILSDEHAKHLLQMKS